jgi:hypothetical protein
MPPQVRISSAELYLLIGDFLRERGLFESARTLERESGVSPSTFGRELALIRESILDGVWASLIAFLTALSRIPPQICQRCLFLIYRQIFLEALLRHDVSAASQAFSELRSRQHSGGAAPVLFRELCYLASLPSITQDPNWSSWNPYKGRYALSDAVLAELGRHLPIPLAQPSDAPPAFLSPHRLADLVRGGVAAEVASLAVSNPHAQPVHPPIPIDVSILSAQLLSASIDGRFHCSHDAETSSFPLTAPPAHAALESQPKQAFSSFPTAAEGTSQCKSPFDSLSSDLSRPLPALAAAAHSQQREGFCLDSDADVNQQMRFGEGSRSFWVPG